MIALPTRVQTEEIVPMESAIITVLAKLDLQTKTVPHVGFAVSFLNIFLTLAVIFRFRIPKFAW